MDHQDFKPIVFNSNEKKEIKESQKEILKKISQKQVCTNDNEIIKIFPHKKLGQLLSQGRLAKNFKTQNDFVKELNQKTNLHISIQIYSKWESNREIPTNEQIAKMEKILMIKLPRNKKNKIEN